LATVKEQRRAISRGVVAGLGQVGEQGAHLGRGLEPVLGGHPAAFVLAHEAAVGDAEQYVVRGVGLGVLEIDVVGGDEGHVLLVGEGHQFALAAASAGMPCRWSST
jgi:hypothetical protein